MNANDLLIVAEVADVCQVTPPTVRRWLRAGLLQVMRSERRLYVPAAEVRRLLQADSSEVRK